MYIEYARWITHMELEMRLRTKWTSRSEGAL